MKQGMTTFRIMAGKAGEFHEAGMVTAENGTLALLKFHASSHFQKNMKAYKGWDVRALPMKEDDPT